MAKKAKVTHTENESVIVELDGLRYEVYLDNPAEYGVFIGKPGAGAMLVVSTDDMERHTYWPRW